MLHLQYVSEIALLVQFTSIIELFHVQDVSEYVPANIVQLAHCLRYISHVQYVWEDNCTEETVGPFNSCDRVAFVGILQWWIQLPKRRMHEVYCRRYDVPRNIRVFENDVEFSPRDGGI